MNKADATKVLEERGWLSLTPPAFRAEVLSRLSLRDFTAGESVYRIGDLDGGLWAVVSGGIEIEIPGPEMEPPGLAHFATPGFWFGEGTVIYPSKRRVGVVATRISTLATILLADCRAILQRDPSGWQWIALLATMTSDLAIRLSADLLVRDPAKRTAAMLLRLAGMRNGRFLKASPAPISLSREKLGNLANLSRNSIGPILIDFAKRGYIEMHYRSIVVTDQVGLSSMLAR